VLRTRPAERADGGGALAEQETATLGDPEQSVAAEAERRLQQAPGWLPPMQRSVFLPAQQGVEYEEIARASRLGRAARVHYHTVKRLKEYLT
jgi:DNA-directed RNA polymerase specialized sigma24 family protein